MAPKGLVRRISWTGLGLAGAILALGFLGSGGEKTEELPALQADPGRTSVSGLSSGAYMAGQFQLAHARSIKGAALVAGGPFACADSPTARALPWPGSVPQNLMRATSRCMGASDSLQPDPAALVERARGLAQAGDIDPLAALAGHRVYLFSGAKDSTVGRSVVAAAKAFYLGAGVPEDQIAMVENPQAGHAFLAKGVGNSCAASASPFLNDCGYDQAGALLTHIYGPLAALAAGSTPAESGLTRFDQRPYTRGLGPLSAGGLGGTGLADSGYAYVPPTCRADLGCAVHIVFHGCKQGAEFVGDTFVKASGFAPHSQANRLVILFPQVRSSHANPQGCWDWWGYTSRDFLTRNAPQTEAVWRMLRRLAERR